MIKLSSIRLWKQALLGGLAALLLLSACQGAAGSQGAAQVVEAYFQALVAKDANQMINLSCAAWEASAKQEYDSFAAVETRLEDAACQAGEQDGEYNLVTCSGKIIASYGAEDLEIDLGERTYQTVQEGGEWRMCGSR